MAISETMSNRSEWMQFYPSNFSNVTQTHPASAAATSTSSSVSAATSKDINNNNLRLDHGRISKPLRRRSRASRRTPTTLFNTDTTNFRAMVQKFTGGYISPLTTARYDQLPSTGGATLGFNVFGTQQLRGAGAAAPTMAPAASGFHMQYSNQLQQHNMFMISNMQGRGGGTGASSHAPPAGSSFKSDNRVYNDNYMI